MLFDRPSLISTVDGLFALEPGRRDVSPFSPAWPGLFSRNFRIDQPGGLDNFLIGPPTFRTSNPALTARAPCPAKYARPSVAHDPLDRGCRLVLVIAAARNLPGLLQRRVLERLTLEPSSDFALTTLFRNLIPVGGPIIIANYLGLTRAELPWLVAALSVGLGCLASKRSS